MNNRMNNIISNRRMIMRMLSNRMIINRMKRMNRI